MSKEKQQKNKYVLIVDDIEVNRAILSQLFSPYYSILEAENGKQAMELVEKYSDNISVMLLDLIMPVMDGMTTLSALKSGSYSESFPVVLITAESAYDIALKSYSMRVSDIIAKPFDSEIVLRRVQNIIELYEHRHDLEDKVKQQTRILSKQSKQLQRTNKLLMEQTERLRQSSNFVVDTMSTIVEFRNGESGSHIRRIRGITRILIETLAAQYDQYRELASKIDLISSAAAMHDIGKIAIPDSVLLKPGRLTPEEFEIMKTHTTRGCELLEKLAYNYDQEYYNFCYEICRHHHERWDGKGYPDGLVGDQTPIWAQVVAVADVYDALCSKRVYKDAYSHQAAVKMIGDGECGCFNPDLLSCFLQVSDVLRE